MKAATVGFYCWVVQTIYEVITHPVLYTTSVPAIIGRPFTFVCTWSEIEASRPNATTVTWARNTDNIIKTDITTCKQKTLIDVGHSLTVGYGYQSLTVWNISSGDTWYCSKGGLSNGYTVAAKSKGGSFLSTEQPVIDLGSTFTLSCSSDKHNMSFTYWYMDDNLCFTLGESCKVNLKDYCGSLSQNLTEDCTHQYYAVTFHNASVSNHNTTWSCKIAGEVSNSVRVVVLNTDFRRSVTISDEKDTGSDFSDTLTLTCSGRCQETDSFIWRFDSDSRVAQNTSNKEYHRCNGLCRQNLTLYADDDIPDIHVTCSVLDKGGSLRASTHDYRISGDSSADPDKLVTHGAKPWHILVGVGIGVVAICAVVVATVAYTRKRRAPQSSAVLRTRNVLYEPGEPYLQKPTGNTAKAVMEDNCLYEKTSDAETQATDKLVMEENILYEMEDSTLGEL